MTSSESSLPLLEMLRQNKITIKTLSAAKRKQMVIEHQSEFPIKVRTKIAARAANAPSDFWDGVDYDVFSFIAPIHSGGEGPWEGPDRSVDSEDEIELALRLFPNTLKQPLKWDLLLVRSNAVNFLPLLWKLQKELIPSNSLPTNNKNVLSYDVFFLLTNDFEDDADLQILRCYLEKYYGEDKQYGRESLLVLERMRKEGLLGDCSIVFDKVHHLFGVRYGNIDEIEITVQSLSFIGERVRLMVQWDASIIERLWKHLTNYDCLDSFADSDWLSLFRMIFELGMTHFPMKLGFVFHTHHHFLYVPTPLYNSVTEIIQDIIPKYLSPNVTLRSLILAAAVDDDISLTGLYTLINMDPSQLISVSTVAAKSKKRKLSAIQASAKSF